MLDSFFLNFLPNFFSNRVYNDEFLLTEKDHLLGERLFLTKKRQNIKDEAYEFDNIRAYEPITITGDYKYENKTSLYFDSNVLIKNFLYDNEKIYAYGNLGGLQAQLFLSEYYNLMKNNITIQDSITSSFDNYIILEYMFENIELDLIVKYSECTRLEYGQRFFFNYNIDIIAKSFSAMLTTTILRIVFIIIVFLLVIWETIGLIREIKMLNASYNKWYSKIKINASLQAKSVRKYISREIIRKLKVILDPSRVLLLIILILFYIYILMFVIVISKEATFYSIYNDYGANLANLNKIKSVVAADLLKSNTDYVKYLDLDLSLIHKLKNYFTEISDFRWSYDKISAVLLFLSSLRIIFSMNLGEYFYAISQIMIKTLVKNLMIIIFLGLMLPSFIFYSYLIFGPTNEYYYMFTGSTVENFLKIFDFKNNFGKELKNDGFKNFYILLFGFTMNLIILNLFNSIINKSYRNIKVKIFYSKGNFSWLKVICFCFNKKRITNNSLSKQAIENEIEIFSKTHSPAPMVNINVDYKTIKEFVYPETEKIKEIDEALGWLSSKTDMMQFSLQNRENSANPGDSIDDNKYRNIDECLLNLQYYSYLKYLMQLNNVIENDIITIKENSHKLSYFLLSQKDVNLFEMKHDEDEKVMKELIKLEAEYETMLLDIEKLRKMKHECDDIINEKSGAEENKNDFEEKIEDEASEYKIKTAFPK